MNDSPASSWSDEIGEAMNLHLFHFLFFTPAGTLPDPLMQGLSLYFPNLSLTREEEPSRFLRALSRRQWDMIFLFPPVGTEILNAIAKCFASLDMPPPLLLFLAPDDPWPSAETLQIPTLTIVRLQQSDLFFQVAGRFLLAARRHGYLPHLSQLLDFLDEGFFILDVLGNFLYANEAIAALQGTRPDLLLGRNYQELLPDHLAPLARRAFEQVLGRRRVWSKAVTQRGSQRIFHVELFPLEHDNHLVAIGGVLRDITAAETQRQREQNYRHRRESQYIALTQLGTHPNLLSGRWEEALALLLATSVRTLQVEGAEFWRWVGAEEGAAIFRCQQSHGSGLEKGMTFRLPMEGECWFAFSQGRLIVIDGFNHEDKRLTPYRTLLPPDSAIIATPLLVHNEPIGILIHHQAKARHWFADELSFAERLTAYLSQAYLAAELRRRNRILHHLTVVGRNLESAKTLDDVVEGVREAAEIMGFTWLALIKERTIDSNQPHHTLMMISRRWSGSYWTWETSPTNETLRHLRESLEQATSFAERLKWTRIRQEDGSSLPLILAEAWRWENRTAYLALGGGDLSLQRPLDEETRYLLNMLADIVAAACSRIRFIDSLQLEKERMGLIHQLTQHLLESLDSREVARRALDELCLFLGAPQGTVTLFPHGKEREGELLVARGFSGEQWVTMTQLLLETKRQNLTRWVLRERRSVILNDAPTDPRWSPIPGVDDHVHSVISVPLLGKGQVLGVLNLYSEERSFFDSSHLQLVESVASTIAVALYNASLFRQEQERRRFAEALEEAVAVVNSDLQFDEMMDRILEQVERVIGGDTFNIMLLQKQMVRIVRWRGYEKMAGDVEIPIRPFPVQRYPSLMRMAEEGCSVCIPDTRLSNAWVEGKGDRWRRSYVGAPIRIAGVTVGFLNANSARPSYFNESHARRLEAFAEHVAIAIRNARLYQTLQQYADQLERRVEERTAELLAQYARLNAVLNSTTNGIVVTDAEGEIIQSNPVATRWLTQHFSTEEARTLREQIRQMALRARERPEEVVEFGQVALHLRASPVRGSEGEGEIGHVVVAIDDVSQIKALERLKAQFISNISHELRTPLTAIKLYAQLLRRKWESHGWEDASVRRYLKALEQEIAHQATLVEEVLNFSRLDSGQAKLERTRVDLVKAVRTVWAEMQVMGTAHGLDFRFEAKGPLWSEVDVEKIKRAVRNLLINAIRYTDAGGHVHVAVHPCRLADGRDGACIRVEDTGMGIAEEEIEHLFDRFYRGEEAQRRQIPGTGLGLAIVKEVVRLHGGICTVHSEVGKGSTFIIRLPLSPSQEAEETSSERTGSQGR